MVKLILAVCAAVAALALAGWQAWRARSLGIQLQTERSMRVLSQADAAQGAADAAAAQARDEAEVRQRDAIEKLNREVVHVDPADPGLAAALDRAAARRTGDAEP